MRQWRDATKFVILPLQKILNLLKNRLKQGPEGGGKEKINRPVSLGSKEGFPQELEQCRKSEYTVSWRKLKTKKKLFFRKK